MKLRDFVQIKVVGHDSAVVDLGQLNQFEIDLRHIRKIILNDLDIEVRHFGDALQNVQTATAAVAFHGVGGIRHQLKLAQHEAGNYQSAFDKSRLGNVGDATVDDHARIQG